MAATEGTDQNLPPEQLGQTVGGSALPGGVMMRTKERVGLAVRSEESGEILTESFEVAPPKGRWATWPLMRGVIALRAAAITAQKSMTMSERLRWGEEDEDEAFEPPKILILLGALLGAGLQIAAFRIGPVVIAKEAGLTGAAFIVADAALRLLLLLGVLWLVSLLPPFRRILAYHGAEHKAIAAYEGKGSVAGGVAAGFTRFHPRCGTSFLVVSAVVSIAVYGAVLALTGVFTYFALIATRLLGAPVVTAIAFEFQRQAAKRADGPLRFLSWPGLAAQRLTTAEPRPDELEVSAAALRVALGVEEPTGDLASVRAAERSTTAEAVPPMIDPQPTRG
ncbi:MAG: DUF1385 domain-containing protein [Thermoleophilia bacterium]|nr:DUF1385 domain-containing protein [Thermoleophilia bacterium]MDH3724393.1 DUF1385 domain-containing protein [Thermoleophilia bacterium]